MPRPRLLIVDGEGGSPVSGGHTAPDLTVRLHQGFVKRFDLTLAVLGPRPGYQRLLPPECDVLYLPAYDTKWGYLRARRRTRRALDSAVAKADLVLVRQPSFHGLDALDLARAHRAPAVCFVVGIWEEAFEDRASLRGASFGWIARRLTMSGARKGALVLAQGTHLSEYLARHGIRAIPVTESALEADDFVPPAGAGGPPAGQMRIVCVSRLVPTKNIEALVRAVASLSEEGMDPHLSIVGDGPHRGALQDIVVRLGVRSRVRFAGRIEDRMEIRRLLSSSQAFVLPSISEGVPLSVLEAMAAGTPVVAAPVGGLRDLLRDGRNALVVAEPTPAELHHALVRLRQESGLVSAIAAGGRETARGFLHDAWVERFAEIASTELSGVEAA